MQIGLICQLTPTSRQIFTLLFNRHYCWALNSSVDKGNPHSFSNLLHYKKTSSGTDGVHKICKYHICLFPQYWFIVIILIVICNVLWNGDHTGRLLWAIIIIISRSFLVLVFFACYFCYIIFIIYALRVTMFMTSPLGVAVGLLSI